MYICRYVPDVSNALTVVMEKIKEKVSKEGVLADGKSPASVKNKYENVCSTYKLRDTIRHLEETDVSAPLAQSKKKTTNTNSTLQSNVLVKILNNSIEKLDEHAFSITNVGKGPSTSTTSNKENDAMQKSELYLSINTSCIRDYGPNHSISDGAATIKDEKMENGRWVDISGPLIGKIWISNT